MVVRGTQPMRALSLRSENPRTRIMPMQTQNTALRCSLLLSLLLCGAVPAAELQVHVTQLNGKPLPGAVVTLHALGAGPPPAAPVQTVMDQLNLAFAPDVL